MSAFVAVMLMLRRVMLTDELGEGKTLDDLCLLRRNPCMTNETEASKLWWEKAAILRHISVFSMQQCGDRAHCVGIKDTCVLYDVIWVTTIICSQTVL